MASPVHSGARENLQRQDLPLDITTAHQPACHELCAVPQVDAAVARVLTPDQVPLTPPEIFSSTFPWSKAPPGVSQFTVAILASRVSMASLGSSVRDPVSQNRLFQMYAALLED